MSHPIVTMTPAAAGRLRRGLPRRKRAFRPASPERFEARVVPTLIPPISIPGSPAQYSLYPHQVPMSSPAPYLMGTTLKVGARNLFDGRYYETFTNVGTAPITVGEATYTIFNPADALITQEYLGSQTVTLKPGQSGTVSAPASPCGGTQADSFVGAPITNNFIGSDYYVGRLLQADDHSGYDFPANPATDGTSAITASIAGAPVAGGTQYLWFNAALDVSGLSATKTTTVRFFDSTVSLGGNTYPAPNGFVTFSPTATKAQTVYDAVANTWFTTVPSSVLSGRTFLDGFALPIPAGVATAGASATWQGQFFVDQPGVTVQWQWGAAAYNASFAATGAGGAVTAASYNALGVKPVASSGVPLLDSNGNPLANNADNAGSPEEQKAALVRGGTGAATYTGSYSDDDDVEPCEIIPEVPTGPIQTGDTATIGYWQNPNGRALILSLNGGPNATNLASYLTTAYPNLYPTSLIGTTNASVLDYYLTLFNQKGGPKLGAQVLDLALATYVTNSTLAGNVAAGYGFNVSSTGTATRTFTDTTGGAALLGLAGNTSYTIADYLNAANANAINGVVITGNTGTVESLFDAINTRGDIR